MSLPTTLNVDYAEEYKSKTIGLMESKPFKQKIWEWQFFGHCKKRDVTPVVFVDKWDTVVGFNGTMPISIKYNEEAIDGIWSCDFFVDDSHRGKGLGRKIKEELHQRAEIVMALGVSNMAAPVLARMGWKENREVELYRRVNTVKGLKTLIFRFLQFYNSIRTNFRKNGKTVQIEISNTLPDKFEVDKLWSDISAEYGKIVIRNYDYLSWRYLQHPLIQYSFYIGRRDDELCFIAVTRKTENYLQFVDFIGSTSESSVLLQLLDRIKAESINLEYVSCLTSNEYLKYSLIGSGFHKQKSRQRFYIYTQTDADNEPTKDWFIMAGDSDGELLLASEDGPFRKNFTTENDQGELRVTSMDDGSVWKNENEWKDLLSRSSANPLFLEWGWQFLWWKQWGEKRNYKLLLLRAYDTKGRLVGIASMYQVTKRLMGIFPITQAQFVGSSWGSQSTVRSEFLDFLTDSEFENRVKEAFLNYLAEVQSLDELVLVDMDNRSYSNYLVAQKKCFRDHYVRKVHQDVGTLVNTEGDFAEFLAKLGKHTRLKVFNRRSRLQQLGEIEYTYAQEDNLDYYFEQLNSMHVGRWGKPCFDENGLAFHKKLARRYLGQQQLSFSMLLLSGKPIGVLYNIIAEGREYNIQAGYLLDLDKKISVGLLHLGYAIEEAFENSNVREFDLLAGEGKNTFYKSHFGSNKYRFSSWQIIKNPYLAYLYKFYDELPLGIRQKLGRFFQNAE